MSERDAERGRKKERESQKDRHNSWFRFGAVLKICFCLCCNVAVCPCLFSTVPVCQENINITTRDFPVSTPPCRTDTGNFMLVKMPANENIVPSRVTHFPFRSFSVSHNLVSHHTHTHAQSNRQMNTRPFKQPTTRTLTNIHTHMQSRKIYHLCTQQENVK